MLVESNIKYFSLFIDFNSRYATVQPFILSININLDFKELDPQVLAACLSTSKRFSNEKA